MGRLHHVGDDIIFIRIIKAPAPKFNEASLISSPKIPSEGSGKED
jgi:hypothetical protein